MLMPSAMRIHIYNLHYALTKINLDLILLDSSSIKQNRIRNRLCRFRFQHFVACIH